MRAILWLIVRLARSKSPYVATKAQLLLAVDCVQPQMFNWCEAVLRQLKAELIACKTWSQQIFGYGTLIVSFILEKVPVMHPRMSWGPFDLMESRKGWWSSLDPHIGGGLIWHFFVEDFFQWLRGQIVMIDDYVYKGIDFTSEPDLMFPPRTKWGPQGENDFWKYLKYFLAFECLCDVFMGEQVLTWSFMLNKDVAPLRPIGKPCHMWWGGQLPIGGWWW